MSEYEKGLEMARQRSLPYMRRKPNPNGVVSPSPLRFVITGAVVPYEDCTDCGLQKPEAEFAHKDPYLCNGCYEESQRVNTETWKKQLGG